jgi:hypothetical protein
MADDAKLREAATALCSHVDGIDWDGAAVQADVNALLKAVKKASSSARATALDTLVDRLRRARLGDADGVAHVAISAGTLVEHGAPASQLADVLLAKLPEVLDAARRYANTCLADLPPLDEGDDGEDDADSVLHVDQRAVPRDVFRKHLAADRPGACSLVRLREWVLPTIASLTRDREMLRRASADGDLRRRAHALRDSDAHWLHVLLRVELDARWLVLCPIEERGFQITLDGVTSNFELHTLVAAALTDRGVPGEHPPKSVVAFLEGRADSAGVDCVPGVWNFYDWRAARFDLAARNVPTDLWVWNEGSPQDVPMYEGIRTLLIGPPSIRRTWNVGRSFSALAAKVNVDAEISSAQVRSTLDAMKRICDGG